MELIKIYQYITVTAFFSCLLCICLSVWRRWFGVVAIICFVVFISSALMRDKTVAANLDELGCEYIGSVKKGVPHSSPTRYYKSPNGVIRSR